jgi:hypothetical protein
VKQYSINYTNAFENTLRQNGYRLIDYTNFGNTQVRSMQAWNVKADVEDLSTGEVITIDVLQSYNTLVAYKMNGETIRCGRWSSTTSKQTTIWARS